MKNVDDLTNNNISSYSENNTTSHELSEGIKSHTGHDIVLKQPSTGCMYNVIFFK